MDDPAPSWPHYTMNLIDETQQFVTREMLDHVECYHHIKRFIRLHRQGRQKVAFFYPFDAKTSGGPNLLGRTVHPANVDVSFPPGEMNEGAMTAAQFENRAAAVCWEMGLDKFGKVWSARF